MQILFIGKNKGEQRSTKANINFIKEDTQADESSLLSRKLSST
jgi:hypothetical protein